MTIHRLRNLSGPSRRNFIKWIGAAGAAVGLERTKLLNFLGDNGGVALADEACATANPSVHIVCGNGSFAWFQLLWPHIEVAESNNANFAYHAFGNPNGFKYLGGDQPFYYAPEAPWIVGGQPMRPMTAFMAGKDETHTQFPDSAAIVGGSNSMVATCASIQSVTPAIVPVIGVDPLKFGSAPGAPAVATVPNAQGMIDLFNSVASQLTLLAQQDKDLFETYYKAFLGIRYAAGRPSWAPHIEVTKKASQLIGFNYGPELTPSAADLQSYGLTTLASSIATSSQKSKLDNFGRMMISSAKALKLGLTNSVILGLSPGATGDTTFTDPHVTFASQSNTNSAVAAVKALGDILNGFYNDLATTVDPACTSKTLDKSVILTAHGDTPHSPLKGAGDWIDPTPQASNWMYVMGNGYLGTGWYGGVRADGGVNGWNPTTGQMVPDQSSIMTATAAGAAVAYAVAKGNMNTVAPFYVGSPITGVIKPPPP